MRKIVYCLLDNMMDVIFLLALLKVKTKSRIALTTQSLLGHQKDSTSLRLQQNRKIWKLLKGQTNACRAGPWAAHSDKLEPTKRVQ